MNIFIADIKGNKAYLTEDESWHCARVLRKRAGEQLRLIDGKGHFYEAIVTKLHERECVAEIVSGPLAQKPRNYRLHLAIAPTKQSDRIEWMVEKAVEIGVDEISFFTGKNSERTVIKTERIKKIAESAVKQSLQAFIPVVNEQRKLRELMQAATEEQKLIAHCYDETKRGIGELQFKNRTTLALIGPEGDFTQEEVAEAAAMGFSGLHLGANRLRTETAGLYVCQAAALLSSL